MGIVAEDFDDCIDELTTVIGEIQRLSRQISVQKAQCSRIIIWCHEVVNTLREAEEDENVYPALNEFHDVLKAIQKPASSWSQPRLGPNLCELGLLLAPTIDRDIELFLKAVLDYTKEFPSIFVSNREAKWRTDLERCRTRDRASNRSTFIALIDGHEDVLGLAAKDPELRLILDGLAKELDIVEEWLVFVSDIDKSSTSTDHEGEEEETPNDSPVLLQETIVRPESPVGTMQEGTLSEKQNIDLFWDSMLKLEEKAESDPTFGKQLAQLRKLAQATMISNDEGVTGRSSASLMKHIAILKPPSSTTHTKADGSTELPDPITSLSVAKFASGLLNPSPATSLSVPSTHVTHVLEYLKHHPSLDRFRLCIDISQGLAHMHSQGVVLGDFAPYNVTIDESGLVQLRELNLSSTSDHCALRRTSHLRLPDARYIPPEVITLPLEQEALPDLNPRKSDVYAFTLLLYEILSGLAPWDKLDIPSIVSQVTRGNRPTRPSSSKWLDNDELWALLQSGWHQAPDGRPDMTSYSKNLDHWKRTLPYPETDHDHATIQEIDESEHSPINTYHTGDLNSLNIGGGITFDISRQVRMVSSLYAPYAHGGFCDVFIGRRGLEKVAMKRLRITTIGDEEVVKKRFIRECEVWRKLKHPNVLEFYGMVRHGGSLFMISPFLDNGDAPTWLESRCGDRLRVLLEAAQGCLYLHALTPKPTIHGDLKGANILIKGNGEAVLSDFGLSKTMNAHTSHGLKDNGTGPYMAPELFAHCNDPDLEVDSTVIPVTKTLETDVFAFGRTAIELLSGQVPYGKVAATPSIWYVLLQGKRPARPNTPSAERWITDAMWTFINEMTHVQPECRPTLAEVVARLERLKIELDSEQVSSEAPDETELAVQEVTEAGEETAAEALHLPPNRSSAQAAPSKGILKPSLQEPAGNPTKPFRNVQFAAYATVREIQPWLQPTTG